MDFKDLIKSRRSCRTFTEQQLTEEQTVALMRAALMSPSSHRTNGWQFVLVDEREKLQALSMAHPWPSSYVPTLQPAMYGLKMPLLPPS